MVVADVLWLEVVDRSAGTRTIFEARTAFHRSEHKRCTRALALPFSYLLFASDRSPLPINSVARKADVRLHFQRPSSRWHEPPPGRKVPNTDPDSRAR